MKPRMFKELADLSKGKAVRVKASELVHWVYKASQVQPGVRRAMAQLPNGMASPIIVKILNTAYVVISGQLAAQVAQDKDPEQEVDVWVINPEALP